MSAQTTIRSHTRHHLSTRTSIAVAFTVALLGGVLAACTPATTPRAVLNVPGTYVADLWGPDPGTTSSPDATVVMCLDAPSAVFLETGPGSEGAVGTIKLDWAGAHYEAPSFGSAVTLTTPVLQPGCGLLTFGVDCCHVDHYLAIKATKV